ncbi:MAG: alpha/beta hydrolase [Pseudolabrys sp.]
MKRDGRISLRAKSVRVGLSWFVSRARHETLDQSRRRFLAMEALIPYPPRDTQTITINAGGVSADRVITPASRSNRHVLYLHGGAYRLGAPSTYRHVTWRIASAAQARVLVIDYRLAPEHPFPAALEDAVSCYRWLLAEGTDPRQIAVIGDSAGGGLALALLLKLRDSSLPLPAAAVVLSPWTDLALTGASLTLNAKFDAMVHAEDAPNFAADYLAGADPRHPYASPLYGDPTGLPPTLIQVGSDEVLRDDAVRMAERMQRAHCQAELQIWPRMPHVWHLFAPILPEAREAITEIGKFVQRTLPAE